MPPRSSNHRPTAKARDIGRPLELVHGRVEPSQIQSGQDNVQGGQSGQLETAATASPVLTPLATSWAQMPSTLARGITSKRLELNTNVTQLY